MEDLPVNPEAKKIADILREQQMQQMMQRFVMQKPNFDINQPVVPQDQPPMQNNMGAQMYAAGGQMPDVRTPNGVPQGFLNPPQTFQRGINVNPLMVGVSAPMGEGTIRGNIAGANVNAPGYSRTGINQMGLGYSRPLAGGTISADVNMPTQGSNYNAALRYTKPF